MKIKVCGITQLENLEKIQKLDVDHMGFINIKRSKRHDSIDEISRLHKKVLNRRVSTLVLEPDNPYEALEKTNRLRIYNIQLHCLTPFHIKYLHWINRYTNYERLNITRAVGLTDKVDEKKKEELKSYAQYANNILLDYIKDGKTGGTNTQIPIETAIYASKIIKKANPHTQVTLAGGLNYEYLQKIEEHLGYFDMIDLNSGVEDKAGIKNIRKIKKIINLVKN